MILNRVVSFFITVMVILGLLVLVAALYFLYSSESLRPLLKIHDSSQPKTITTPQPTKKPSEPSSTITISYDKLYSLINGYRRDNKLSALTAHRALEQSAALKLADMQQNHYWTHKDPQGRESWYLFDQIGYHFEKAGENLSFGYTTEWKIFDEWRNSPEHNTQLLDPNYEHMGLAADCSSYAQGTKNTCIVVLHLGKQKL